ncbi:DUF4430 domain-containing protein [Virgibacillus sp. 179-BFC.A HS]|uniref:DUF4430 domain-containing protein n=1 Tax=Tigheibacillus jepli TaxID=3035914 RepID=A0ABU5CH47_9BACI|nr:DUF4430 domain-containing protein [Virgibacillus sp. 179-BFC.A HS]MDY0405673.1 DUF4430 domain-containing protein [Virgibacillus sp. 179-BFC.A HS]
MFNPPPGDEATKSQSESSEHATETQAVTITISRDKGKTIIAKKEVAIKEDDKLMRVLKKNFDVKEEDGFITSIEEIAPENGEKKGWIYTVNGKMASVGADEYKLKPGDDVVFDFQSWE